jgi:adenylosuccinate synthase
LKGLDCRISLILCKLDVLDSLDSIKICVAYELNGKEVTTPPYDAQGYADAKTVCRSWMLPPEALL